MLRSSNNCVCEVWRICDICFRRAKEQEDERKKAYYLFHFTIPGPFRSSSKRYLHKYRAAMPSLVIAIVDPAPRYHKRQW